MTPNVPSVQLPAIDTETRIQDLLTSRYAGNRARLCSILDPSASYNTAYRHIMIERHIMHVCNNLVIQHRHPQIIPAVISDLCILPGSVCNFFNVDHGSLGNIRTTCSLARCVLSALQARTLNQLPSGDVSLYHLLETMLGPNILPPYDPANLPITRDVYSMEAVRLSIAELLRRLHGAQNRGYN